MAISSFRGRKPKTHVMTPADILAFAEAGVALVAQGPNEQALTSYYSKGQTAPDEVKSELGSAGGGIIPDRVPVFTSRQNALRQFQYMLNDDAGCDVSIRAAKMPVMGADFFIEPGGSTDEDKTCKEFVEWNLFTALDMPWLSLLEDHLHFLEDGFSVAEKCYGETTWAPDTPNANRKNYTILKCISPRPAITIGEINYDDNGKFTDLKQSALRADRKVEEVTIQASKLIVLTHGRKGGNIEGKSLLRTAYKHWYYKNNLYTIDGIQKERHGMGFPVLTLPPQFTKQDMTAALELVRNIRTNQMAGAVLPPGFVLEFVEIKSNPVDVMKSIDHHNGMIMLNILVAFILAGVSENGGGGRASSASQQDMFTKTLKYLANLICDVYNKEVIPELVGYNFDVKYFPKMRVRNIGESRDLQQWGAAISNLIGRNGITMDLETEQWIRRIADFPVKQGDRQTPEANMEQHLEEIEKGVVPGQAADNGQPQPDGTKTKPTGNTGANGKGVNKGDRQGNMGLGNNAF